LKRIRHFTSRHAGSAHDARIFNESHLKARLEANFDPNSPKIILGDEGYACSRVLLTPIRRDRVADDHQRDYNRCHKKTRVSVEHAFGMIKKRFPALLYQLRCKKLLNAQAVIGKLLIINFETNGEL